VQLARLREVEARAGQVFLEQAEIVGQIWDSTSEASKSGRTPHVLHEIGIALGLHPQSVGSRLGTVLALREHPLLRGLLQAGRLGVAHTLVSIDEAGALGDEQLAGRVLREVLASQGRLGWQDTPARLRTALRRAAIRLDPDGSADRRQRQAEIRTGVRLRPQPDGLAQWTITGAAAQLIAADRLLAGMTAPDSPDDDRTRGQRQVDALLGALVARAGTAAPVELQLQIPVSTAVAAVVSSPDALPEPVVIIADLTPDLLAQLTGTSSTGGTGTSSTGGTGSTSGTGSTTGRTLPDTGSDGGSAPAGTPGTPATPGHAGSRPFPTQRPTPGQAVSRTISPDTTGDDANDDDSTGGDTARDCSGFGRTAGTATPADSAADAAPPGWRARRSGRRRSPRDGVRELLGHGPIDPALLTELLTDPAGLPVGLRDLRIRRVCVDRTGQAVATDASSVPLHQLLLAGSKTTGEALSNPAALLARLLTGLPEPPPRTSAYKPTAAQARTVRARDLTCCFPGCNRPSSSAELDHRRRHPDGPTSTANLHPLCKHHHDLKHDGWTCTRHPDGTTTWTSPRGQHATSPRP